MEDLISIALLKAEFDKHRPLSAQAVEAVQKYHDIELTHSSNALAGNQLTLRETAEVIDHGVTTHGKTVNHHLEALDHYEAVGWMRRSVAARDPINEATIVMLHRLIMARSQPDTAGRYDCRSHQVITSVMADMGRRLRTYGPEPTAAFEAHQLLVGASPFKSGNGQTARLLMNMMLIQRGYPPIAIAAEQREMYESAIERSLTYNDHKAFQTVMSRLLLRTFAKYMDLFHEAVEADAALNGHSPLNGNSHTQH